MTHTAAEAEQCANAAAALMGRYSRALLVLMPCSSSRVEVVRRLRRRRCRGWWSWCRGSGDGGMDSGSSTMRGCCACLPYLPGGRTARSQ